MVGSFINLLGNVIFFITEPLSMLKLLCQLCTKVVCFATLPWIGLAKFAINMCMDIGWSLTAWIIASISLPIRIFNALQKEKSLEARLYALQNQLEELILINEDMKYNLEFASRDQKEAEIMISKVQEQQDRAIEKIRILEIRLRDSESDNLKLRELQKRMIWETEAVKKAEGIEEKDSYVMNEQDILEHEDHHASDAETDDCAWDSEFETRGKLQSDNLAGIENLGCTSKMNWEEQSPMKTSKNFSSHLESTSSRPKPKRSKETVQHSKGVASLKRKDKTLHHSRGVALMQSAFSACLSLLVGMVAWEAQDPCMPLVIALFIVVVMSLKSVVRYFSAVQSTVGFDAVALLSFNWFILGALTSPALPNVVRFLSPFAYKFVCRVAGWLGFTFLIS